MRTSSRRSDLDRMWSRPPASRRDTGVTVTTEAPGHVQHYRGLFFALTAFARPDRGAKAVPRPRSRPSGSPARAARAVSVQRSRSAAAHCRRPWAAGRHRPRQASGFGPASPAREAGVTATSPCAPYPERPECPAPGTVQGPSCSLGLTCGMSQDPVHAPSTDRDIRPLPAARTRTYAKTPAVPGAALQVRGVPPPTLDMKLARGLRQHATRVGRAAVTSGPARLDC